MEKILFLLSIYEYIDLIYQLSYQYHLPSMNDHQHKAPHHATAI